MDDYENSPDGYGLHADSVPSGFVAVGADNDTWISIVHEGGECMWIRTSEVNSIFIKEDGTPTKHDTSPIGTDGKKRKSIMKVVGEIIEKVPKRSPKQRVKEDSPSKMSKTGCIKSKSGILWLGDPIDLFVYAQKHGLEHFLKQIGKTELSNKHVCTAAHGLAWTSVNTDKSKPVYCSEKPGDKQPESICIVLNN